MYVLQKLGLFISSESGIELTTYSRLWSTDVHHAIRCRVEGSLKDARDIQLYMEQYSHVSEKESYLVQHHLALINFQEVFIFSLARIFFINVLAIETIRPQLKKCTSTLLRKQKKAARSDLKGGRIERSFFFSISTLFFGRRDSPALIIRPMFPTRTYRHFQRAALP